MFHVYVLQSEADGGFYVGLTNDPERRLRQHNAGLQRSTRARRPLTLVYSESCASREEARRLEKLWKSGQGRERLLREYGRNRQPRLRRAGAAN